jgi:hypothetical protein
MHLQQAVARGCDDLDLLPLNNRHASAMTKGSLAEIGFDRKVLTLEKIDVHFVLQ